MTAWTDHVKNYAKKHNVSYKEAMTLSKSTYKKQGGKGETLKTIEKKLNKLAKKKGKGCEEDLQKEGIYSKGDANKWALKNHPDKKGDPEKFKKVFPCIQAANQSKKYPDDPDDPYSKSAQDKKYKEERSGLKGVSRLIKKFTGI